MKNILFFLTVFAVKAFGGALDDGFIALKNQHYDKAMNIFLLEIKKHKDINYSIDESADLLNRCHISKDKHKEYPQGKVKYSKEDPECSQEQSHYAHSDELHIKSEEDDAKIYKINCLYALAMKYYHGFGVNKNYPMAVGFLYSGFLLGDIRSQRNLALMYYWGHGVVVDYARSMDYFYLAANQDDLRSLYHLAVMHFRGYGVESNFNKGFEFLYKLAKQANINCRNHIGFKKNLDFLKIFI